MLRSSFLENRRVPGGNGSLDRWLTVHKYLGEHLE